MNVISTALYKKAMKFAEVALQLDSKDQSNPDQKTATQYVICTFTSNRSGFDL
jgi:hypothetical protein